MSGERDINLQSLRAIPEKNKIKMLDGLIYTFLGEILLNLGDTHLPEAEHWIRKAIDANESNGTLFYKGLNHALYADFFKRQGNRTSAQANLGKAIDILRQCGADGWVQKYERELATIQ